jgi:hypothetical protein
MGNHGVQKAGGQVVGDDEIGAGFDEPLAFFGVDFEAGGFVCAIPTATPPMARVASISTGPSPKKMMLSGAVPSATILARRSALVEPPGPAPRMRSPKMASGRGGRLRRRGRGGLCRWRDRG